MSKKIKPNKIKYSLPVDTLQETLKKKLFFPSERNAPWC